MKQFEIEVVRTYATTIKIGTSKNFTEKDIERIAMYEDVKETEEDMYHEIWDIIGEKELQQMDTDLLEIKVKTI